MSPMAVEKPAAPAVNGKAQAEPSPAQPRVDSFDAATATTAELAASLKRNGCLYLRGLIGKADMDQINQDMRPHLDDDTPWDGACFPPQTKRLSTVVAKSTAFRQKVLMNQQWLDLSKALLNVTTGNWFGDTQVESTAEPILGNTVCFRILPGAAAQGLHRDSMVYHLKNPACTAEEYTTDRDTSIGIFLAGTRTTRENGATRFCPGSHLEQTQQPPSEDRAVYAEMEPGDALIMFSSVYHAGSANVSQSDERLVYNAQMTKGFMRTAENQYLAIPREQAATWTDEELAVCGYMCSHPFLGVVEFMDPVVAIRGQSSGKRYDIKDMKVVQEGTTAAA